MQFRPRVSEAQKEDARKRGNAKFEERINRLAQRYGVNLGDLDLIELPPGISLEQAMAVLEAIPPSSSPSRTRCVTSSRRPVTRPTPTVRCGAWRATSLPPATSMEARRPRHGRQGYTGSASVYVGVIDTGIQFDHPDLQGQIWTNPFDPVDTVDNDGNGLIDDVHGWDFWSRSAATPKGDNTIYDDPTHDDHGTHVSGTIGGKNDGSGVVGVNWNVTIISAKFLGGTSGSGTLANQILAMDYITNLKVQHGLNIVATNNSYGAKGFAQSEYDAVVRAAQANILTISAAWNSALNNDIASNAFYPASYDTTPSVGYDASISVAAITSAGALASFSNFGANSVDLGAPGAAIYSSIPASTYDSWNGTSMATPHVTGAAALYAAANPGATAAQIREALLSTTAATASLAGKTATGGRLDIGVLMGLNDFGSAIPVSGLPRQFSADTSSATIETGEPTATGRGTIDKTVWYSYTASSPTVLTVSTAGSSFDTLVAVYTGNAVDALTRPGCLQRHG